VATVEQTGVSVKLSELMFSISRRPEERPRRLSDAGASASLRPRRREGAVDEFAAFDRHQGEFFVEEDFTDRAFQGSAGAGGEVDLDRRRVGTDVAVGAEDRVVELTLVGGPSAILLGSAGFGAQFNQLRFILSMSMLLPRKEFWWCSLSV
jgi:hypothetical protein